MDDADWTSIEDDLNAQGNAVLSRLLPPEVCAGIQGWWSDEGLFRSHVHMARHGFGRGEYRYFRYPLPACVAALREFPLKGRRRITIEYVMLKGVNDSADDLSRLPKLLRGIPSKINLIPYNQNTGLGFVPPERPTIDHWQSTLLERGMNATVRWSKGEDISAACGQLATEALRRRASKAGELLKA